MDYYVRLIFDSIEPIVIIGGVIIGYLIVYILCIWISYYLATFSDFIDDTDKNQEELNELDLLSIEYLLFLASVGFCFTYIKYELWVNDYIIKFNEIYRALIVLVLFGIPFLCVLITFILIPKTVANCAVVLKRSPNLWGGFSVLFPFAVPLIFMFSKIVRVEKIRELVSYSRLKLQRLEFAQSENEYDKNIVKDPVRYPSELEFLRDTVDHLLVWGCKVHSLKTGVINLQLRTKRSGSEDGREYTLTITFTDTSGNRSIANMKISVSHD